MYVAGSAPCQVFHNERLAQHIGSAAVMLVMVEIETTNGGGIFWAQAKIAMVQAKSIEILPEFLPKAGQEEVAILQHRRIDRSISRPVQERAQSLN